jgi:spore coat protein CotH
MRRFADHVRAAGRRTWGAGGTALLVAVALVAPSCSGSTTDSGSTERPAARGEVLALFDESVMHSIEVDFDQADYETMIENYAESDDKSWIKATVSVDGVRYKRAGVRLKGNSSLMGLRRSQPSGDAAQRGDEPSRPAGPPGFPPGLGSGGDVTTPELLPWLIRLDKFVEDQRHQGYADIVVRSNSSKTSLNEAVALDLLSATPLASQRAISTTFSINGRDPVLRLAIEHPDDDAWQDRSFKSPGALYKAESSGDWSYRGDDPDSYADVFDQEGGKKVADLTPLVDFLKFVNESDDETFTADLRDHLDVDSFATYLALMELLGNFDDIDGPGNNSYLWWDEKSERVTIVPWDMNLAFGAMPGMPPGSDRSQLMADAPPPGGGPGGRFGRDNALVRRFHQVPEFEEEYQDRLAYFRADLFQTGAAATQLAARVKTLRTMPVVVDETTIAQEADSLRERFTSTAGAGD